MHVGNAGLLKRSVSKHGYSALCLAFCFSQLPAARPHQCTMPACDTFGGHSHTALRFRSAQWPVLRSFTDRTPTCDLYGTHNLALPLGRSIELAPLLSTYTTGPASDL